MLKKSQRLLTKQFNQVMSKGKVLHSTLFMARVLKGQVGTKIAAVAPVKPFKRAVDRNKVRRKIYNALRPVEAGTHIIIFAKIGVLQATLEEIAADLKSLFVKAGILG